MVISSTERRSCLEEDSGRRRREQVTSDPTANAHLREGLSARLTLTRGGAADAEAGTERPLSLPSSPGISR
uniref:Uncharacterized protein n=1 Tax=Knipowitschia caucasica TaxID=637954 RepID=A0AAV2MG16_KNICA